MLPMKRTRQESLEKELKEASQSPTSRDSSDGDSIESSATPLRISTSNQMLLLLTSVIEVGGRKFNVLKIPKTCNQMIEFARNQARVRSSETDGLVERTCSQLSAVMAGQEASDPVLRALWKYVRAPLGPLGTLSNGRGKFVVMEVIKVLANVLSLTEPPLPFIPSRGEFGSINLKCLLIEPFQETSTRIAAIPDVIAMDGDGTEVLYTHENKKSEGACHQLLINVIGHLLLKPARNKKWLCGACCKGGETLTNVKISLVMGAVEEEDTIKIICSKDTICSWKDLAMFMAHCFCQ